MSVNIRDKYYTPDWLVEHTIKKAIEIIGKENITEIVEPGAGDGAFIESLKKAFPDILHRYYDLYPEHPDVIEQDYKKVRLTYKRGRMTIGNPPFGTSSCLWKAFCKKAATNSDYIAFISPASQYKSNYYFKEGVLVYSELLNDVEYRGSEKDNGKSVKVRTCLNIYKVYDREEAEDWRIKRLEQDVIITRSINTRNDWDFYLGRWGAGKYGKIITEIKQEPYCIKILNENKRKEIEGFFNTYREIYHKDLEQLGRGPNLSGITIKNHLIKYLYPTREERLEQDIEIHTIHKYTKTGITEKNWKDYDLFITSRGQGALGKVYNYPKYSISWAIKILNETRRKEIEYCVKNISIDSIKNKENNSPYISEQYLKNYLIETLYPEDPNDFPEYPEIKKPVHIERAIYAKELF